MTKTVSLPSKLRREIVALAKLNPRYNGMSGENEVTEKIDHLIFDIVDVACASLQGTRPSIDMDLCLKTIQEEITEIQNGTGLLHWQKQLLINLERHYGEIRDLCQDSALQDELAHGRVPIPSYSNLTETVLLANGQLMAESFRLFLESFGIQAILGRESAGVVYGLTVGPLGEVDVKVTPENEADSRILLDAMKKGIFALDDEMDLGVDELSEESSDDKEEEISDDDSDDF